jgi:hypothetical protein
MSGSRVVVNVERLQQIGALTGTELVAPTMFVRSNLAFALFAEM